MYADTTAAILSLGDIKARIRRRVLAEVLQRCLFLYYWSGAHECVTGNTTWDELLRRAVALVADLGITMQALTRFAGPCVCIVQWVGGLRQASGEPLALVSYECWPVCSTSVPV